MKKLHRARRLVGSQACHVTGEKRKTSQSGWSEKPDLPKGETGQLGRLFCQCAESELARKPNDSRLRKECMDTTFVLRRHHILTFPRLVQHILVDYPEPNT